MKLNVYVEVFVRKRRALGVENVNLPFWEHADNNGSLNTDEYDINNFAGV